MCVTGEFHYRLIETPISQINKKDSYSMFCAFFVFLNLHRFVKCVLDATGMRKTLNIIISSIHEFYFFKCILAERISATIF